MVNESITVDELSHVVTQNDLHTIRTNRLKWLRNINPTVNNPFNFISTNSEPNLELLKDQISNSVRNLASMEEDFLVFPSDIDAEGEALKARFGDAVDKLCKVLKKKTAGKGT
ncbi:hypothetical protein A2U01_0013293 [Trifolium medium]|uniref:Uncharacterized protein n=1 Tax=Trifolium medium TaxID=97028 RepID=A0A392MZG4_9FABA|nr:hypothetical protein [Trifolium medium]